MAATVFVSGATGFIAQHVVKQLLDKGYNVVGSVRSAAKGEKLKKNFGSKFSYEIVEDLESVGAFDRALKKHPEVTIFLHTASPLPQDIADLEKGIILPAINGTKNVLKAIKESGPGIKTVVVTSSAVTQIEGYDPSQLGTEDTWNSVTYESAKTNFFTAYIASKVFAEKAGIEFVKNEKPNFKLTTVHPVYVFGPQVFDEEAKGELNFSNGYISNLLKLKSGTNEAVPSAVGPFVDVRDVAAAHLLAFEKPADDLRILTFSDGFTSQKVLNIINKNFPQLNLIKGTPTENIEGGDKIRNPKSNKFLGLKYIDLEQSVVDTISQFIAANK